MRTFARYSLVFLLGLLLAACSTEDSSIPTGAAPPAPRPAVSQSSPAASQAARPTAADALAAARAKTEEQQREVIQNLILDGIFSSIELQDGVPRVLIRPAFRLLTFRDQQSYLAHVYAFAFREDTGDRVLIFDSEGQRQVGVFTESGLQMN